jgi:RHS repeat-associated protein
MSQYPVYLRYGYAIESATDILVPGPGMNWSMARTYSSGISGTTTQGNKWFGGMADVYLFQDGSYVSLMQNATSKTQFTVSGSSYTAPGWSSLSLTHNSTTHQFTLTDGASNMLYTFNDLTVSQPGKLLTASTLQWSAQSKAGQSYSYNTNGTVSQITTSWGQDWTIAFTWTSSNRISKIQVKDASNYVLQEVDYTYYENVTSPSTNLGTTGDLVQVQVSKHATTDSPGTMSIVRYTQYRYSGTTSQVKAVYENDAIQRILASTGLSTPAAILSQGDTYGSPTIQTFASRSFTYYGSSPPSATNVNTPFATGENLVSKYTTSGSSAIVSGMVATETIGGCGSCGTAYSVTKNYFYMSLPNSTTDQNQVVSLVVEDTQDSGGSAIYRTVYGFENMGRVLRKAFIQSPESSPTYWCESWKFATSGMPYRLQEHRYPSAHTGVTTATNLQAFLNPYNGSSWTNDTNTVNTSSGQIEVFGFNSGGYQTDAWVKDGESGTAYYVSATDYGDSINPAIVTATWDYPTQTTTRSSGLQTSISYTFYDSSTHQQIETQTTTLPAVPTTQNGSGVATTTSQYYDNLGRLRWTQDGEGYINYTSYNPVTGAVAYQAVDVNPASLPSAAISGSSGNWDSVSVGAANSNAPTRSSSLPTPLALVTATYFDELGRQTQVADAGGNNHYKAYANLQSIYFPFWNSTTSQCTLPIQVTNLNNGGQVSDQISVRANYTAFSTSSGAPTGFSTAPSQSDYVTWTHYTYDSTAGHLMYTDNYVDSPASGSGTLSTDFYRTVSQYDTLGRLQYVVQVISGSVITSEVEQVTQYVYDIRDRVVQINKAVSPLGQNMTSSYNVYPTMYAIAQTAYDNGGVGDGYVTRTSQFFGTGSTNYTGTNYYLTFRGDVRGLEPFYMNGSTLTTIGPYTVLDVDWKGRAIATAQYSADPSWTSVLTGTGYTAYATSTSTNRLTQGGVLYDNLGRVYQSQVYDISPSTGSGSNYLAQNMFYDRNNSLVATTPAYAAGTETAYDGAGRRYETRRVIALQSTSYSSGAYHYCAPVPIPTLSSMSGGSNGVLTLAHTTFDANSNALETDSFEDNHDDVISSSPGINLTNNNNYVRHTVFNWYDTANRPITTADYGSGDTSSGAGRWTYATIPSRPSSAPTASANTSLVTLYTYYSDSGRLQTVTDPLGTLTKFFYDNLGRKTYLAQNWQNFVPPSTGTGNPNDRVTQYVYSGPTQLYQLVAMDPAGTGSSPNQVTTYAYADSVAASRKTSEKYPDSGVISFAYNVDGSLSQRTDQRGTVLAHAYTNNRLLANVSATTLGTGVDGTVQSIARTYDNLNRPQHITSYGGTGGTGTVVNDIQYAFYDGFNGVATSYQEHYGAVNTSTSLNVQYTYDATTTGSIYSNQLRPLTDVHPNGRTIYYDYGPSSSSTAAYSATSTVREIWDGSPSGTGLAVYDYNGAGSRLAIATFPQPSFKLDHLIGSSGTYAGLDRFGRIIDQYWAGIPGSGVSDVDRIHYAYDYDGNRSYRQIDPVIYPTDNLDQAYTYDALSRLLTSQIGTLNTTTGTISGTPPTQEAWTLDGLGNWAGYVTQASGTPNLNQTRTASLANQISGVSASVGSTWATPAYDLAGNMTTIPIPTNLTSSYTAVYDAWNRMVSLTSGSTTIATYAYDGLSRRVTKGVYTSGSLDHNEDAYFNENWNILEVRKTVSGTINNNPLEQYVWHPFYIDAPVLRDYDATCSGSPTRYYFAFDGNYNVTAVTTSAAAPTERYYYSPYGNLTFLSGTFAVLGTQQSQIGNAVTYTGRQLDAESGLYLYRNRYYHGQLGCFIGRDPIEYMGRCVNLYMYTNDNPLTRLDPFGLITSRQAICQSIAMGCNSLCGLVYSILGKGGLSRLPIEITVDQDFKTCSAGCKALEAKCNNNPNWPFEPFNPPPQWVIQPFPRNTSPAPDPGLNRVVPPDPPWWLSPKCPAGWNLPNTQPKPIPPSPMPAMPPDYPPYPRAPWWFPFPNSWGWWPGEDHPPLPQGDGAPLYWPGAPTTTFPLLPAPGTVPILEPVLIPI